MAEDEPRWYYVGNGELRLKDADGWTEQYKTIESPRARAGVADPVVGSETEEPTQAASPPGRRGLKLLVGLTLLAVAGVGGAFATGVLDPPSLTSAPVARDAAGFALGGPKAPSGPVNYNPSPAQCLTYRDQLSAWATYQNAHPLADSTKKLPKTSDVQYLHVVCGLKY